MVTSKQSPHLLPPLTSFGLTKTRDSSGNSAAYQVCRATCASSKQDKIHLWIASTSDRRPPETDNIDTESHHSTDEQEQNPCDEARDYLEHKKGRWVTLFDPMHDEQPFCQNLTERTKMTVRFPSQQSEMIIDDTWPQMGEMRSLCEGTTEF